MPRPTSASKAVTRKWSTIGAGDARERLATADGAGSRKVGMPR